MLKSSELALRKRVDLDESIKNVRVNWLSGDIRVIRSEDARVHVFHYADTRFSERKLMRLDASNGTLNITDGRRTRGFFGINMGRTILEIRVPAQVLNSFWISTVGGKLWMDAMQAQRCYCKITSGSADISGVMKELELIAVASSISGNNLKAEKLDMQSGSTKVRLSGEFRHVQSRSTGRGMNLECLTMPESLHSVSTGEKISVTIPSDNEGFEIWLEERSGAFKSDFNLSPCNGNDKRLIYKKGKSSFNMDIRGGSFHLKSHQP